MARIDREIALIEAEEKEEELRRANQELSKHENSTKNDQDKQIFVSPRPDLDEETPGLIGEDNDIKLQKEQLEAFEAAKNK